MSPVKTVQCGTAARRWEVCDVATRSAKLSCALLPGAHILSGNVLEPRALNELIPDWKDENAPVHVHAKDDRCIFMLILTMHMPELALRPPIGLFCKHYGAHQVVNHAGSFT